MSTVEDRVAFFESRPVGILRRYSALKLLKRSPLEEERTSIQHILSFKPSVEEDFFYSSIFHQIAFRGSL